MRLISCHVHSVILIFFFHTPLIFLRPHLMARWNQYDYLYHIFLVNYQNMSSSVDKLYYYNLYIYIMIYDFGDVVCRGFRCLYTGDLGAKSIHRSPDVLFIHTGSMIWVNQFLGLWFIAMCRWDSRNKNKFTEIQICINIIKKLNF